MSEIDSFEGRVEKNCGSRKMKRESKKTDYILTWLILVGASIQNRFFDEIISVAGMDAVSLLLTLILFFSFGRYILNSHFKFNKTEFVLTAYMMCICVFGVVSSDVTSSVLLYFRTMIYFMFTFVFFKNVKLNEEDIIHVFKIAGFSNALICLFFYIQNVRIYGAGFRDVSINLYFSLFAIILCLFSKTSNEKKVAKLGIIFICTTAIITSQQRTQIIPLALVFALYVFASVGFDLKKMFNLALICAIFVMIINIAQNIGMLEFVKKRLEISSILNSDDTLGIRFATSNNYFSTLTFAQWLLGTGLTGKGELEMLVPNYIYKYGILGTLLIFYLTLFKAICQGIKFENTYKRFFMIALFIMAIGGVISGFGGQNGQLFVAAIMGAVSNREIFANEKCKYTIPFVGTKISRGGA